MHALAFCAQKLGDMAGMTNSIAIGLGMLILGGLAIDAFLTGGDGFLFLASKGVDLLDWIAFWR